MRTAALPNFRKLYGRIDTPLAADTQLTFDVDARKLLCLGGYTDIRRQCLGTVTQVSAWTSLKAKNSLWYPLLVGWEGKTTFLE